MCVFTENTWSDFSTRTKCWSWPRRDQITRRSRCCRVYWRTPTEERMNWRRRTGRQTAENHAALEALAANNIWKNTSLFLWLVFNTSLKFNENKSKVNILLPRIFWSVHAVLKWGKRFPLLERWSVSLSFPHKDLLDLSWYFSQWPFSRKPSSLIFYPLLCGLHFAHCSDLVKLVFLCFWSRLINQRLMEEQSQVEELQKSLQEQDSKADDVSNECLVYIPFRSIDHHELRDKVCRSSW